MNDAVVMPPAGIIPITNPMTLPRTIAQREATQSSQVRNISRSRSLPLIVSRSSWSC